jgi:hypothetical protein
MPMPVSAVLAPERSTSEPAITRLALPLTASIVTSGITAANLLPFASVRPTRAMALEEEVALMARGGRCGCATIAMVDREDGRTVVRPGLRRVGADRDAQNAHLRDLDLDVTCGLWVSMRVIIAGSLISPIRTLRYRCAAETLRCGSIFQRSS